MPEIETVVCIGSCCVLLVCWLFWLFSPVEQKVEKKHAPKREHVWQKEYAWQKLDQTHLTQRIAQRMKQPIL